MAKKSRKSHSTKHKSHQSRRGYEAAQRHIEEHETLRKELGGSLNDVEQYFFEMPAAHLEKVLEEYGDKYGQSTRSYAEYAYPLWRSGRKKMSGMVASRLFQLLPPRMPLDDKYSLVESLWEHFGPAVKQRISVYPGAKSTEIASQVQRYLDKNLASYHLPEPLEARFQWLAAEDVKVYQQMLNHFQQQERDKAVDAAQRTAEVLTEHLRTAGAWTRQMNQTVRVGKHSVELIYQPSKSASPNRSKPVDKGQHGDDALTPPHHLPACLNMVDGLTLVIVGDALLMFIVVLILIGNT